MLSESRDHLFPVETFAVPMAMDLPGGWHSDTVLHHSDTDSEIQKAKNDPVLFPQLCTLEFVTEHPEIVWN